MLIAVVIEGEDEVTLLRLDPVAKKLSVSESQPKLVFPSTPAQPPTGNAPPVPPRLRFPSLATFDSEDRLWVIGGPPLDTSKSMHLGVARAQTPGELHWEGRGGIGPGDQGMSLYPVCYWALSRYQRISL